jgi:hypothetical protein
MGILKVRPLDRNGKQSRYFSRYSRYIQIMFSLENLNENLSIYPLNKLKFF